MASCVHDSYLVLQGWALNMNWFTFARLADWLSGVVCSTQSLKNGTMGLLCTQFQGRRSAEIGIQTLDTLDQIRSSYRTVNQRSGG